MIYKRLNKVQVEELKKHKEMESYLTPKAEPCSDKGD